MKLRDSILATLAAAFVLATMPWLLSDFALSLALTCLMYAGLAVSWAMFCGATNYLSLATAAFFGLGAYITAWGAEGLPYGLAVLIGGMVAAVFAGLIGAAVLHLRGAYFAVITFGLAELVRHAVTYFEKAFQGTVGRVSAEPPGSVTIYHPVLLLSAAAVIVALVVRSSRLGLALRGIGADEERAQTLGVNARRAKITAFQETKDGIVHVGRAEVINGEAIMPVVQRPVVGAPIQFVASLDDDVSLKLTGSAK